jgi:hypothetical protein
LPYFAGFFGPSECLNCSLEQVSLPYFAFVQCNYCLLVEVCNCMVNLKKKTSSVSPNWIWMHL